ncbi:MAG: Rieske 2Fe-2S domain-containing protein [Alphaproteobacteria bacterium]|nr:Rieske 2Fe-2S domain-containing protein [Alphaproteobacteria bacterium]
MPHATAFRLQVDERLADARLPDAALYRSPEAWTALCERVLAPAWHLLSDEAPPPGHARGLTLLPGALDEPAVLAHDDQLRLLGGACSHRGHLLLEPQTPAAPCRALRCRYHGRRFDLTGRCLGSPGFDAAALVDADLPTLGLGRGLGQLWAAVSPREDHAAWWARSLDALGPLADGDAAPDGDVDHRLDAHWALYVENYLEGLHIPHVHPGLAREVDLAAYTVELQPDGVLQLAPPPSPDAPAVVLPDGRRVAAAWLWRFPTTMINVYPWGVSLNAVVPVGPDRTIVRYRSRVWRPQLQGRGAGGALDRVEAEDQQVVARVMAGLRSRRWRPGRYASAEAGVHHFHRLLALALQGHTPSISRPTPG